MHFLSHSPPPRRFFFSASSNSSTVWTLIQVRPIHCGNRVCVHFQIKNRIEIEKRKKWLIINLGYVPQLTMPIIKNKVPQSFIIFENSISKILSCHLYLASSFSFWQFIFVFIITPNGISFFSMSSFITNFHIIFRHP